MWQCIRAMTYSTNALRRRETQLTLQSAIDHEYEKPSGLETPQPQSSSPSPPSPRWRHTAVDRETTRPHDVRFLFYRADSWSTDALVLLLTLMFDDGGRGCSTFLSERSSSSSSSLPRRNSVALSMSPGSDRREQLPVRCRRALTGSMTSSVEGDDSIRCSTMTVSVVWNIQQIKCGWLNQRLSDRVLRQPEL